MPLCIKEDNYTIGTHFNVMVCVYHVRAHNARTRVTHTPSHFIK